jgi:hypothetical protein
MDSKICQYDAHVNITDPVAGLGIRKEVAEEHLPISEEDDGALVHHLNMVREGGIHRLKNQQIN